MKTLGTLSISIILFFSYLLIGEKLEYKGELSTMQGYLHSTDDGRKLYLEDYESGYFTALKFAVDQTEDLDFEDLEYVEIIGYYNDKNNVMEVELLHMLPDELVVNSRMP